MNHHKFDIEHTEHDESVLHSEFGDLDGIDAETLGLETEEAPAPTSELSPMDRYAMERFMLNPNKPADVKTYLATTLDSESDF